MSTPTLRRTPLYDTHVARGARIVPFAGYEMPVQYADGIIAEHQWTRAKAGMFDVSHMGWAVLVADDGRHETVAATLETLVPADIAGLAPGQQRYTQLLGADGGILDDLMVTRAAEPAHAGGLVLVVNASRKDADLAHIETNLPAGLRLLRRPDNALIAVQGPAAVDVVGALLPPARQLAFMTAAIMTLDGIECHVSRSGYTGEDGFEIAVHADHATTLWQRLASDPRTKPTGLGARDTLRLEAGLCLYGHDIDETTSPIEAGLAWSIGKRRRTGGGFPGAARIQHELADGPSRKRVGIRPDGRAPAREGTEILSASGQPIGKVTSGGFAPSLDAPIAMGYVATAHASPGTSLQLVVRGKPLSARVVTMPFVAHRYARM